MKSTYPESIPAVVEAPKESHKKHKGASMEDTMPLLSNKEKKGVRKEIGLLTVVKDQGVANDNPDNIPEERLRAMRHVDPEKVSNIPEGYDKYDFSNFPEEDRAAGLEAAAESAVEEKFENKFGINSEDLKNIEGFADLSLGQRAMVLENLQQLTLSRIKDESLEDFAAGIQDLPSKEAGWLARAGVLIENTVHTMTKGVSVRRSEKYRAKTIAEGGLKEYGQTLQQLTNGMQGAPEVLQKNGRLEMQFLKAPNGLDEEQKNICQEFNDVANEFMRIPKEYSYEEATPKQKRQYEELKNRYESSRAKVLETTKDSEGDINAFLNVNSADAKVQLNQFVNQSPDAEAEIIKMAEQNHVVAAMKDFAFGKGATKRLAFVAGGVIRSITVSTVGFVAAPLVGGAIGYWRSKDKAKTALNEKDADTRKGKIDKSAEAKNFVAAEDLEIKIDKLFGELDTEGFSVMNDADSTKKNIDRLEARINYTQDKIDDGLVVFGKDNEALNFKYRLLQKLSQARARLELAQELISNVPGALGDKNGIDARLERFLDFKKAGIDQKRKKYIKQKALQGALICGGFAMAGYGARHLSSLWFGGQTPAPVFGAADQGAKAIAHEGLPVAGPNYLTGVHPVAEVLGNQDANAEIHGSLVNPVAPGEAFDVPVIKPDSMAEVNYQGGHSIWEESQKQLSSRFGEKFASLPKNVQELNIARLQQFITGHRETFGIEADQDFTKMSAEDLEKINWNEAANLVFADGKGLVETAPNVVHNLHETLVNGDKIVPFNGAASSVETLHDQYKNAADFFDSKSITAKMEEFSDNYRRLLQGGISASEKQKIFADFDNFRERVKGFTGGTVSFGMDGDIKLVMPDGGTTTVFHNPEGPAIDFAKGMGRGGMETPEEYLASGEAPSPLPIHRASLGYRNIEVASDASSPKPAPFASMPGHHASRGIGDIQAPMETEVAASVPHRPSLGLGHEPIATVNTPAVEHGVAGHHTSLGLGHEHSPDIQTDDPSEAMEKIVHDNAASASVVEKKIASEMQENAEIIESIAKQKNVDLKEMTSAPIKVLELLQKKTDGHVILTSLKLTNDNAYNEKMFAAISKINSNVGVHLNDKFLAAMDKWEMAHNPSSNSWATAENFQAPKGEVPIEKVAAVTTVDVDHVGALSEKPVAPNIHNHVENSLGKVAIDKNNVLAEMKGENLSAYDKDVVGSVIRDLNHGVYNEGITKYLPALNREMTETILDNGEKIGKEASQMGDIEIDFPRLATMNKEVAEVFVEKAGSFILNFSGLQADKLSPGVLSILSKIKDQCVFPDEISEQL